MHSTPAPIVVGVDDAAESRAALLFALREAIRRGSPLDVVTAWTWQPHPDASTSEDTREWARALAQQVQDTALAETIGDFDNLPVLSRQVVEGDAAQVLLRIARTADYLVVGSSRGSAEDRILLGSVSDYCVRHSKCPVLVVPSPITHGADQEMMVSAHD